jgi:hypothetical protein
MVESKEEQGHVGMAKPAFGPYTTLDVIKLDSPVNRTKIKDSEGAAISISRSEGIDITKLQTIEKQKQYKLLLGNAGDTTQVVFAIASVPKERKQTVVGRMLSKNEESSSAVLSYNRNVSGMITTGTDTAQWEFLIDDFTSSGRQAAERFVTYGTISAVYLKNGSDSFYAKLQPGSSMEVRLFRDETNPLDTLKYRAQRLLYNCIRTWMHRISGPLLACLL